MTIREMQYTFGIQLNQFNTALQLESDDIEYWLNKSQEEFVKTRFNGINRERAAFEQTQQRIDDLRVLIEPNKDISTIYTREFTLDGFYVDSAILPNNYMFLLNQKSICNYNCRGIEFNVDSITSPEQRAVYKRIPKNDESIVTTQSNRYSQTQTIHTLLSDPFNTTKVTSPLTVVHGNRIDVYTDKTFIVDKVIIDYLRLPRKMNIKDNVSCELPEHTHKEIIQLAVDLFLQNTRELKQRLQRETPTADRTQNIEENE